MSALRMQTCAAGTCAAGKRGLSGRRSLPAGCFGGVGSAAVLCALIVGFAACSALGGGDEKGNEEGKDEGPKFQAVAVKVAKPVKIDGSLDEWKDAFSMVVASKQQVSVGPKWKGATDASAQFYVMWDEANIYFAASVADDRPFRPGALWMGDGLEIFIDLREPPQFGQKKYTKGCHQCFLLPKIGAKDAIFNVNDFAVKGAEAASKKTDGGWTDSPVIIQIAEFHRALNAKLTAQPLK